MSVGVQLSSLSSEQLKIIKRETYIVPRQNTLNRFQKRSFTTSTRQASYFNLLINDWLYLPFSYACSLFGCYAHDNFDYPKVKFEHQIKLIKNEYLDQESITTEALEQLQKYRTTTLKIFTGGGKTIMAIYLMTQLGYKTLIMCPNIPISEQWKNAIEKLTNARVGLLESEIPDADVVICYYDRLTKLEQCKLADFGLLMMDEAHMLAVASNQNNFFKIRPKYIIALTATLARADGFHEMIRMMVGYHYVRRTNPYPFQVVQLETGFAPEPKLTERGTDYNDLVHLLSRDDTRNCQIMNVIYQNLTGQDRGLILTNFEEHVKILAQWCEYYKIPYDTLYGSKKSYTEQSILIGTYKKIGVGFDEANYLPNFSGNKFKYLIMAIPIKHDPYRDDHSVKCGDISEGGGLEQVIGRVMRSINSVIYYLVDDHKTTKNHWSSSKRWFKQFKNCQLSKCSLREMRN